MLAGYGTVRDLRQVFKSVWRQHVAAHAAPRQVVERGQFLVCLRMRRAEDRSHWELGHSFAWLYVSTPLWQPCTAAVRGCLTGPC
jgi:hypothetical protein